MPRSAFAFPGDELCRALQGVISYLVMWTQGAEAQATSTAIALDQRIWTLLCSHTQVSRKNTRADIADVHVYVLTKAVLVGKKKKKREITDSVK